MQTRHLPEGNGEGERKARDKTSSFPADAGGKGVSTGFLLILTVPFVPMEIIWRRFGRIRAGARGGPGRA